jgi:hypothetical protein
LKNVPGDSGSLFGGAWPNHAGRVILEEASLAFMSEQMQHAQNIKTSTGRRLGTNKQGLYWYTGGEAKQAAASVSPQTSQLLPTD